MFRLLKNLIKPERPEPLVITFDKVPAWLDERERAAFTALAQTAAEPMGAIREATERLEQIVQTLRAAQYDEKTHPKLKSITKNSLPQFAKAIEISLSRPLPGDAEEFYATAADMLRGCISSSKGQGKYLQTVFPEEMKAVRSGIDTIGREINAMTDALSAYRREMAQIQNARMAHAALVDIEQDTAKSRGKEDRFEKRIQDLMSRIDRCGHELRALDNDDAQRALAEQRRAILTMTEERDSTVRRYAVLSMTGSHVLRKAEKIAHKKRKGAEEKALRLAIELLSDHTVPDTEDLARALAAACPVALRMIDGGEIALKNKEERELFSGSGRLVTEIGTLCATFTDQAARCDAAERALRLHPVVARCEELVREKSQLETILAKEERARTDLIRWRDELRQKIPALQQRLEKTMGEMSGSDVQIHYT